MATVVGNFATGTQLTAVKVSEAHIAKATSQVYQGTGTTTDSTAAEISGLSHTFTISNATNTVEALVIFDIGLYQNPPATINAEKALIINCSMDGNWQDSQLLVTTTSMWRGTCSQNWYFTNLTTGSHTITFYGIVLGAASGDTNQVLYSISSTHTGYLLRITGGTV